LAAITHLYNPIGFPPGPSNDESIYMRRAMHVLAGQGPQEGSLYDHPYFSQIFLASILGVIGYPESFHPSIGSLKSIEVLYLVPRVITGTLAIVDTFLLYAISRRRYGRNVAFIASVLFAIMPLTWLIRRIWLEPIQLPFILASVLFAMYARSSTNDKMNENKNSKKNLAVLFSGVFLGLAIFTKIPAVALVPLLGYIIYTSTRSLKSLGLYFIPILLIPLIWPAYAIYNGQFDLWLNGVLWQMHRCTHTFFDSFIYDFNLDPLFMALSGAGVAFALIKKDILLLLWIIPFLVFLYMIGFVSYWHIIPLLPAFCIAVARLIEFLSNITSRKKAYQNATMHLLITAVGIFGIINTILLITPINLNSAYFEAAAFIVKYLHDDTVNKPVGGNSNDITIISNPFYSWIPQSIFHLDYNYIDYYNGDISIKTRKVLLTVDPALLYILKNHEAAEQIQKNFNLYTANRIATFEGSTQNHKVSIYLYESKYNAKKIKLASSINLS
jgi:dolichyl-phosphate-mannose-protein mannosyltransferase